MIQFVRILFLTKCKRQPFGCLLLFLALSFSSIASQGSVHALSQHPQWKALLHIFNDDYEIADPHFFLGASSTSTPDQEFHLVLEALKARDTNKICRFPARSLWVQESLKLPPFDFNACSELAEFKEKAPAESVAFVFASENISQPTSIMGHSFLKIAGKNNKGIQVEHAISFFTEIEDANFFRLAFESIVTGKKGYYTLTPYHDYKVNYIFGEQRSLWEKYLKLSPMNQQLLQFHLFELKGIEFEYFFHSYNCSTLDYNIIAILFPEIQKQRGLWVTPKDVYKAIDSKDYIETTIMLPSSKWRLKALEEALQPSNQIVSLFENGAPENILDQYKDTDQQFLALELAAAVNDFRFESSKTEEKVWSQRYDELKTAKRQLRPDGIVDLSSYKNPGRSPQDSYLYLSSTQESSLTEPQRSFVTLGFVPASHPYMGDNSQYLSESELKVGQISFDVGEKISLNSLILFSASALQPSTALYRPLSGGIKAGYDRQISPQLQFQKGLLLEGNLGQSYRLHPDIDFYFLVGMGYREALKNIYFEPQIGFLARLIGDFKLSGNASVNFNRMNSPEPMKKYTSQISWNHNELSLDLSFTKYQLKEKHSEEAAAGLRYHF